LLSIFLFKCALTDHANILFQVTATDLDSGSNGEISYNIVKGNIGDAFEIDGNGKHMAILNALFLFVI